MFNVDDRVMEGQGINSVDELPSLDAFDNFKQAMSASFDKFTMTSQLNSGNRYYTAEFDKKITELKTDDPTKQKWLDTYKNSTDPNKSLFERLDKEGRIAFNEDGTLSATDPYAKQYTREFADQVKGYFTAKNLGLNTEAVRGQVNEEMGKKVKEVEEILKKTEGFGGVAGEVLGTMGGFVTDPFGMATLPLGAPARGAGLVLNAAKAFGQEFVIGVATETVSQAANFKWKNDIGMKHDLADAFYETALSGLAGGLIRSGGSIAIDSMKLSKMDWNLEAFDAFDRITYGTKTLKQTDVLSALEKVYDDKVSGRSVNVEHIIDDNPTNVVDEVLGGKSMWSKADEEFTNIEMPAPEKVLEIEELGYNTNSKAELEAFDLELQNIEKGLAECLS